MKRKKNEKKNQTKEKLKAKKTANISKFQQWKEKINLKNTLEKIKEISIRLVKVSKNIVLDNKNTFYICTWSNNKWYFSKSFNNWKWT